MTDGTNGTTMQRDIAERPAGVLLHWSVGVLLLLPALATTWRGGAGVLAAFREGSGLPWGAIGVTILGLVLTIWVLGRFIMLAPYQRLVVSLFERYVGTEEREGISWMIPFYSSKEVSTALANFETETVKVNDRGGSPIDIAVVVVTRIVDAAKATYLVQDSNAFVRQQVVAGIRAVAATHDYDGEESKAAAEAAVESGGEARQPTRLTLRGSLDEVAEELRRTAQERIGDIGIDLVEVRITHLAYAPEIAAAMLKRQQAQAVVAARETIVKGAVAIVDDTIKLLAEKNMALDEDRRATLTSNLLIVLSSDREAAPVLPVGA